MMASKAVHPSRKSSLFPWTLLVPTLLLLLGTRTGHAANEATRITSYALNTTIVSRFATTNIVVDFTNHQNCSTLKGFTLQLPRDARVTRLFMNLSDGCDMNGVVKGEAQAIEEFEQKAVDGKPAALLQAYDATNYGIQVSLPPLGSTRVEVQLEELLKRRRHRVDFSIPMFPGLAVDKLTVEMYIQEAEGGISALEWEASNLGNVFDVNMNVDGEGTNTGATAKHEANGLAADGTSESGVLYPRLLRGYYDTGTIPMEGLIMLDNSGTCLVHLFNPATALLESTGSMPRNILFVVDVSGSMDGQKLQDAKNAFAAIIEKLTDDDYFTIHAFSDSGTEQSLGPEAATANARATAKGWVKELQTIGGTNLEGAYIDGIKRVQAMQAQRGGEESPYVGIVIMLTDGQASSGVTDPVLISRSINIANDGVGAKLFGLAFGEGADFSLLNGISMQHNGLTVRIYEGFGDSATQMENFYVGELGTLVLSDVNVYFDGTAEIQSQTQTRFPVLADGSEIAIRARLLKTTNTGDQSVDPFVVRAVTTANTLQGVQSWTTQANVTNVSVVQTGTNRNECIQSFAHAKIAELMLFRDAARTFQSEMKPYAAFYSMYNGVKWAAPIAGDRSSDGGGRRRLAYGERDLQELDLVENAEGQALQLALEAGVVWPGLTAMVTEESASCASVFEQDVEVCQDGDGGGAVDDSFAMDGEMATLSGKGYSGGGGSGSTSGAPSQWNTWLLFIGACSAIWILL